MFGDGVMLVLIIWAIKEECVIIKNWIKKDLKNG